MVQYLSKGNKFTSFHFQHVSVKEVMGLMLGIEVSYPDSLFQCLQENSKLVL
jgi:hypothetical protein